MIQRLKVIVSAYACEPSKGSESGIGWNWAKQIARFHEVWVLTRANNRSSIEDALQKKTFSSLHFIYYDLPGWARSWKKKQRGVYLYYFLWQLGAYRIAKRAHKKVKFDLVHHITFGSARQPSFMGLLGIPFIFGPVAGGERAPWRLRIGCGFKGWLKDGLRDVFNFMVQFDPLMHLTFSSATKIFITSKQTAALIPARYRNKVGVSLAVGLEDELQEYLSKVDIKQKHNQQVKVLYVGRLLCWKGLHLGLPAFARLRKKGVDATLTLIGSGTDEKRLRNLARRLDISDAVSWIPWSERPKVLEAYKDHDIFLFPSLHDSGGFVVLEALAAGLPVVCLDIGGPRVMATAKTGFKIPANTRQQVIQDLEEGLWCLAHDPALRASMGKAAQKRVTEHFDWAKKGEWIQVFYQRIIKNG